jgi:hypothetical protein
MHSRRSADEVMRLEPTCLLPKSWVVGLPAQQVLGESCFRSVSAVGATNFMYIHVKIVCSRLVSKPPPLRDALCKLARQPSRRLHIMTYCFRDVL